jgi:hypothetical protein
MIVVGFDAVGIEALAEQELALLGKQPRAVGP